MSLPTQTQVLIVGAGPTGMACAITLLQFGYNVTIIDAYPNNKNGSRAGVIHARTLEVLKTIGLAQELMDAGIPSDEMTIRGSTNELLRIDVGQLRDYTEFPVALLIPQHEVERILRNKLVAMGIEVLRPHTVVGMKEAPSGGGLEVTFEDGSIVRSHYVVGADGSRSTIRNLSGIDFKDPATGIDHDSKISPSSVLQMARADVYLEEPLPSQIAHDSISFQLNGFYFMAPLRAEVNHNAKNVSLWRISMATLPGAPPLPKHPDAAYFQTELTNRWPWASKPRVASVEMASRYRVRAAVADTFFKKIGRGSVLLVGDAAHVHSPAGGQGLNLGLCDAVALGHSIRAHIDRNATCDTEERIDYSLKHYSDSRRAVALRVVGLAGRLTAIIQAGTGWRRVVRDTVIWMIGRLPFLRKAIAWRLSGLRNRDADTFAY